jgi:hypothetical protein
VSVADVSANEGLVASLVVKVATKVVVGMAATKKTKAENLTEVMVTLRCVDDTLF